MTGFIKNGAGVDPKAIRPQKNPKMAPNPETPKIPRLQSEICSNSSSERFIVKRRNFSAVKTESTEISDIEDDMILELLRTRGRYR